MATKHWVRDVPLTDPNNYIANGNHIMANAVLYNFLRAAGWEQVWECDGERTQIEDPNHVEDGNVQSAGTTYWNSYNGGVVSKDTTTVHSGQRSLKVVAAAGSEGAETDPLLSMRNMASWTASAGDSLSGPVGREMTYVDNTSLFDNLHVGDYLYSNGNTDPNNDGEFPISKFLSANSVAFENALGSAKVYATLDTAAYQLRPRYEIVVWAATDVAFDVDVDQGDGSYVTVGTIPSNGTVFTKYSFSFRRLGSGNTTIRFVSAAAGTLYIGGLHVFSSVWDRPNSTKRGTDGVLTNPDRFSTGGSFTPDASDVGKVLFVWDPTNNKNSGAYPIIADLGGGVVQLDLRSGSAALTTQSGLSWRVALIDHLTYPNSGIPDKISWSGFGLESPHTSKWRFFLRQSQPGGQTGKGSIMWSAPEDTDFNFSTGEFYKTGPSTQRNRQGPWVKIPDSAPADDEHLWRGGYSYSTVPHDSRCFVMTDADGAFFHFFLWDEYGEHACHLHGYLASTLPGVESHYLMARWEDRGQGNECIFSSLYRSFGRSGTTYDRNKAAVPCCIAQLGIGTSTSNVTDQSNAGPNPWSGNEWKRPLILWRDSETNEMAMALQSSNCGVFQGRNNMVELSTFDSENFLHLDNGLIWEWSGETVL